MNFLVDRGSGVATFELDRRQFLGWCAAGTALLASGRSAAASLVTNAPDAPLRFDILRSGAIIGEHLVSFERRESELWVQSRVDITVKILGVTAFDFHQRSEEAWSGNRLIRFSSQTVDNGDIFRVEGQATDNEFSVTGKKGTAIAPATVAAATYWTADILSRPVVIDTKRGTLKHIDVLSRERTVLDADGERRPVTRYVVAGVIDGTIFYDGSGRWVGAEFVKRGSEIRYRLRA